MPSHHLADVYTKLRRNQEGEVAATFLISHHLPLENTPDAYKNFHENQNGWTNVVLDPF